MEQKDIIINEAIRLFLKEGVDLKLIDIATNIGISKKTIYRYFDGKEDLLLQSVKALFSNIHKEQDEIFNDKNIDDLEKLKKLMIAMPKDFSNFDVNFLVDLNKQYPNVYKKVNYYLESDWEQTYSLLDLCKKKGLIKNIDNKVFRNMFLACTERLFQKTDLDLNIDDLQEQMIEILIGGIKNA